MNSDSCCGGAHALALQLALRHARLGSLHACRLTCRAWSRIIPAWHADGGLRVAFGEDSGDAWLWLTASSHTLPARLVVVVERQTSDALHQLCHHLSCTSQVQSASCPVCQHSSPDSGLGSPCHAADSPPLDLNPGAGRGVRQLELQLPPYQSTPAAPPLPWPALHRAFPLLRELRVGVWRSSQRGLGEDCCHPAGCPQGWSTAPTASPLPSSQLPGSFLACHSPHQQHGVVGTIEGQWETAASTCCTMAECDLLQLPPQLRELHLCGVVILGHTWPHTMRSHFTGLSHLTITLPCSSLQGRQSQQASSAPSFALQDEVEGLHPALGAECMDAWGTCTNSSSRQRNSNHSSSISSKGTSKRASCLHSASISSSSSSHSTDTLASPKAIQGEQPAEDLVQNLGQLLAQLPVLQHLVLLTCSPGHARQLQHALLVSTKFPVGACRALQLHSLQLKAWSPAEKWWDSKVTPATLHHESEGSGYSHPRPGQPVPCHGHPLLSASSWGCGPVFTVLQRCEVTQCEHDMPARTSSSSGCAARQAPALALCHVTLFTAEDVAWLVAPTGPAAQSAAHLLALTVYGGYAITPQHLVMSMARLPAVTHLHLAGSQVASWLEAVRVAPACLKRLEALVLEEWLGEAGESGVQACPGLADSLSWGPVPSLLTPGVLPCLLSLVVKCIVRPAHRLKLVGLANLHQLRRLAFELRDEDPRGPPLGFESHTAMTPRSVPCFKVSWLPPTLRSLRLVGMRLEEASGLTACLPNEGQRA
ncbi:hypothetical protein V8C86DRAFT_2544291, partial [Haematococcus lacustris]